MHALNVMAREKRKSIQSWLDDGSMAQHHEDYGTLEPMFDLAALARKLNIDLPQDSEDSDSEVGVPESVTALFLSTSSKADTESESGEPSPPTDPSSSSASSFSQTDSFSRLSVDGAATSETTASSYNAQDEEEDSTAFGQKTPVPSDIYSRRYVKEGGPIPLNLHSTNEYRESVKSNSPTEYLQSTFLAPSVPQINTISASPLGIYPWYDSDASDALQPPWEPLSMREYHFTISPSLY